MALLDESDERDESHCDSSFGVSRLVGAGQVQGDGKCMDLAIAVGGWGIRPGGVAGTEIQQAPFIFVTRDSWWTPRAL